MDDDDDDFLGEIEKMDTMAQQIAKLQLISNVQLTAFCTQLNYTNTSKSFVLPDSLGFILC